MKTKYYLKRGYFGDKGKVYIPLWKTFIYIWFTNICVFCEKDDKEIWVNNEWKYWGK